MLRFFLEGFMFVFFFFRVGGIEGMRNEAVG